VGTDIRIRMNRSQSLIFFDNIETVSHRNSINNSSIENTDNIIEINNIKSHIAIPVYKIDSDYDLTKSQVLGVTIKKEPFEIDKEWIRQDFNVDYNKPLRYWYFTNYFENKVIRLR
ncbi:hypothetical protein S83_015375, partial [Arachis hypogaea]